MSKKFKFMVGDKVRVHGVDDAYARYNGKEGVVNAVKDAGNYDYDVSIEGDDFLAFYERELELVTEPSNDDVNHPSHYTSYKGIEVIQLTEQMSFNRGNAVKYVARAGLKNPDSEIQDLEKAAWYINREIERLKNA